MIGRMFSERAGQAQSIEETTRKNCKALFLAGEDYLPLPCCVAVKQACEDAFFGSHVFGLVEPAGTGDEVAPSGAGFTGLSTVLGAFPVPVRRPVSC